MVVIKGRIIAKPRGGTRPPLLRGKLGGRLKYVCGRCGYLLAHNVSRKEISVDAVFQCPNCHKYNEA
jgi:DNA-directed RNA polymerase subunit RPC12/RpoP